MDSEAESRRFRVILQLLCLAAVLISAAALRFYGIRWGLPDELHAYSYHPDEFLLIGSALLVVTQSALPRFYNYPSLYIYLAAVAILVGIGYGVVRTPLDPSEAGVYLAPRVAAALTGVGSVAAVYWAGLRLFDAPVAVTAAVVLAVAPLHVQHSHYATVDVPSTLPVALCLGFAGAILKTASWKNYLGAGFVAGLAAGTKYNAGLVILAPVIAHLLRDGVVARNIVSGQLLSIPVAAIVAFVISTPGAVLDYPSFAHGIMSEFRHSAQGHGLVFAATGFGPGYAVSVNLWHGLGRAMTGWFIAAAAAAVFVRNRSLLVLAAFAVPYVLLVSFSQVRFARYMLPVFPAAALMCAWLGVEVWRALSLSRSRALRFCWAGVFSLSVVLTLAGTLALVGLFVGQDPRDAAARWLRAHAKPQDSVGVLEVPWFYSPPYSPHVGFGTLPQREESLLASSYRLVVFRDCVRQGDWARETPPEWVVLSDYETDDALRVARSPKVRSRDAREASRIVEDIRLVERLYRVEARFSRELRFWRFTMGSTRSLPHDMRYPAPTITIYRLNR